MAAEKVALRPEGTGTEILRLARRDRPAARRQLAALSTEAQAGAVQALRPELRSEFLMLLDSPEAVVPLLPEAELATTIRAGGMSEAAWLLEIATRAQRQACFDIDCWSARGLEVERVVEWIDALIEAGRPTLVSALEDLDFELFVLAVRAGAEVSVVGKEDEPPIGAFTEDGVVYWTARDDAAFARTREIAQTAFSEIQKRYWQLAYGILYESPSECEEYAARWRAGRLADLGFPDRDQAMQAYRPLRVEQVEPVPGVLASAPPAALVRAEELPKELDGTLVGQALRELPPARARDVLGYVLAVANSVAVADRLRLSEPDSIPRALEKAVRGVDRGLRELAKSQARSAATVLDETRPLDLFRIAATLDPELGPPPFSPEELGVEDLDE